MDREGEERRPGEGKGQEESCECVREGEITLSQEFKLMQLLALLDLYRAGLPCGLPLPLV